MNLLSLIIIVINYNYILTQIQNINSHRSHHHPHHHPSYNHTHNILNNQRFCQNENHLFRGTWVYGNDVSTDFNRCSKTKISLIESRLSYQIESYYCEKFRSAVYNPTNCHMLYLNDSINVILNHFTYNHHNINITSIDNNNNDNNNNINNIPSNNIINISYIGDSLGGQSYIASKCEIENINKDSNINIEFIDDSSLRNDIPCNSLCIDFEYRLQWNSTYFINMINILF
jgi:hypothetical protein